VARILRVIERHPDGVTIEQIEGAVGISRRTLQRRLAELVADGRTLALGRGKQRRYLPPARSPVAEAARPEELLVSRAGQAVRSLVRRPMIQRTPVGYVAGFLDRYRPNRDFYLGDKLRARLHELGRAPGDEHRLAPTLDDAQLRVTAAPIVAPEDLEQFVAMAISELSGLHEGNLARYRLRPSEFRRWRGRHREPS